MKTDEDNVGMKQPSKDFKATPIIKLQDSWENESNSPDIHCNLNLFLRQKEEQTEQSAKSETQSVQEIVSPKKPQ